MNRLEHLPKELLPYVKNASIYDTSGRSSATVYQLSTGYYLKIDDGGSCGTRPE